MKFRISTHLQTKEVQLSLRRTEDIAEIFLCSLPDFPETEIVCDFQELDSFLKENGFDIYSSPVAAVILEEIKKEKISQAEQEKEKELSKNLFLKNIDSKPVYVRIDPKNNLFQSAILIKDGTRKWGCDYDGKIIFVDLNKEELIQLSSHYDLRKNQIYNLTDQKINQITLCSSLEEIFNLQ